MKSIILALLIGITGPVMAQNTGPAKPLKVAILLFPGVEPLDFAGPLEVLSHMEATEVYTIATKSGTLTSMNNTLHLTPDYTLDKAPKPDILVVPGGPGVREATEDSAAINWIRQTAAHRQLTMSVCTGAFVLAKAGLFAGKTVTTHWGSTQMLQAMYPGATVLENTRFVEDGRLLTTAGVSAGIDGALRVVQQQRGTAAANALAELIAYDHFDPRAGFVVGRQLAKTARATPKTTRRTAPTPVKPVAVLPTMTPLAADGTDPVCRMGVAKGTAITASFGGRQYGFCSGVCRERFLRGPAKYATK